MRKDRWIWLGAWGALSACGANASSEEARSDTGTQTPHTDDRAQEPFGQITAGAAGGAGIGGIGGAGGSGGVGGSGTFGADLARAAPPPEDSDSERYTDVGSNPFVVVAHDPFSTFAADVDTASYDLFRRDVEFGRLPVPDGVRVEEYVNYFAYDYPAPAADAEHPFTLGLTRAANPYAEGTEIVRVAIQARAPSPATKTGANLVFLVDVSGSMQSAEKLPVVKEVLTHTLSVLDPNDTVSIVTYASGTQVRLPPTRVLDAEVIRASIAGLSAGGSTNGAGGIQLAYEQAQAGYLPDGRNHVVLCTDGDFNVGASSDEALVELIEDKRKTGVTLTALGFGIGNLNDSMMEKVSNAGNGIYAVISSVTQARVYVEDRMLSTLEHVAKDVKLQLEWNPEHVLAYRLIGYVNRAIADDDFRDDVVDAGEIGAGHRVTALYEIVPAGGELPEVDGAPAPLDGEPVEGAREVGADELVRFKLRYKQVGATEQDPAIELTAGLAPGALSAADADLQFALAVAQLAEILSGSPFGDAARLPAILEVAEAQRERDPYRDEFYSLLQTAKDRLAK